MPSLNAQQVEPRSRWAKAAEDWVTLLSAKNRKLRLQFTQAHQNWTIGDWKNFVWSDESRFWLQNLDGGVRIKNMKAYIHPALSQQFRVGVVV